MAKPSGLWKRKRDGMWMTTIQGKQHKLGKDKGEARRKLNQLLAADRPPPCRSGMTARRLCDNYLVRTREGKAERSHKVQTQHLRAFCDSLGHRDPITLKVYEVEEWLEKKETWGPSTRALFITIIKAVFNFGEEQGYLSANPLKKLKRRSTGRRKRVLTPEEKERIKAAVSEDFRDFLTVLEMTGCRPFSEAAKLTAADIDFGKGRAVLAEHKNARKTQRPRVIYFPAKLLERLRVLAERRPSGPLLVNRFGAAWTADTAGKYFKRVCKKLGIEGATSYTLRHSFISVGLADGVPVEVLAVLAGNTPAVIHKHYDQVDKMEDALRAAAERAAK